MMDGLKGRAAIGLAVAMLQPVPLQAQSAPPPVPPPVYAPPPAAAAPAVTAQMQARALQLSRILNAEATVRAQMNRVLHQTLPETLKADPNFAPVEATLPGITVDMVAVMEPIIVDAVLKRLPAFQEAAAQIYLRHLTADEIDKMIAFYGSPLGQKVIGQVNASVDLSTVLKAQLATGGKADITAQELKAPIASAAQSTISGLSADEQRELVRFALTPAGRKLGAINAEVLKASEAWMNEDDPAVERQVEQAVTKLLDDRLAKQKK